MNVYGLLAMTSRIGYFNSNRDNFETSYFQIVFLKQNWVDANMYGYTICRFIILKGNTSHDVVVQLFKVQLLP